MKTDNTKYVAIDVWPPSWQLRFLFWVARKMRVSIQPRPLSKRFIRAPSYMPENEAPEGAPEST